MCGGVRTNGVRLRERAGARVGARSVVRQALFVDETCAFHCPKITSVTKATEVVYCEETICMQGQHCDVFGVGLIPLGTGRADRARAVLLMRGKNVVKPEPEFEGRLLRDAEAVRDRIVAQGA